MKNEAYPAEAGGEVKQNTTGDAIPNLHNRHCLSLES